MSLDDPKCRAYSEKIERYLFGGLTVVLLGYLVFCWWMLQS